MEEQIVISQHLKKLRNADLIRAERRGVLYITVYIRNIRQVFLNV